MKKLKIWSMLMLMALSFPLMVSCGGDDSDDERPQQDLVVDDERSQQELVVVVNDNGIASNGSTCVIIDDKNFYLDFVKYSVIEGHLVVSGYDEDAFKGIANIPSKITIKNNTYEVLAIAKAAFVNCRDLTSITIPNSVTSIGEFAFESCSSLTSVIIPNSVTSIGEFAFLSCSSLTSVIIPQSVTSIGRCAFYGCSFTNAKWDNVQLTDQGIESVVFENCNFKNTEPGYRYIHLEIRNAEGAYATTNGTVTIKNCVFENVNSEYCKDSAITLAGFGAQKSGFLGSVARIFGDMNGFWYNLVYFLLIVAFTYFYTAITVRPTQMAEEMKKNSGFIPGIKPGKKTAEYLDSIMSRITLPGSIFLGIVAILPAFARLFGVNQNFAQFFGGTSLLITVGVVLDTLQQIETHLRMHHYDGLMKSGKIKGRAS